MDKLPVIIERTDHDQRCFAVDKEEGMTVLHVLEEIYQEQDASLSYRFSCRTGLCATCTMVINGKPGLSCLELAEPGEDGYLYVAPLPKGTTIRDLVKDMG